MPLESDVARHYASGELVHAIQRGLRALGKGPENVEIADLAPVDELHTGGRVATTDLGERLGLKKGMTLLDVGCGIGGAARFFASTFGCKVTGVDLTPEYVEVARTLTRWTGLEDRTNYVAASALAMPVADASFDAATLIHVGMNIPGKRALFEEIYRALRPGGRLGVYDVMRMGEGDIPYPVPWAKSRETSFVVGLPEYREALEEAGFEVHATRNRHAFAVEFFTALRARMAEIGGAPPLGLHLVMGADAPTKTSNLIAALEAGAVAPVEIFAGKP